MAENINYQIAGINNQITDEFGSDNDLEVTGGGRGWTATTTVRGAKVSAKGSSKLGAAEALYQAILDEDAAELVKADDAENIDIVEGDFEDMTEAEAERCVAECMVSERDYCECKCGGANHGAMSSGARPDRLVPLAVIKGRKKCACGCGQVTQRTYVPGHDAKHHAEIRLVAWAKAAGLDPKDLEAARKAKAAAARKAARERRATKRAAQAEIEAKAAKVAATVAPKQRKRTRKAAGDLAPDALPF